MGDLIEAIFDPDMPFLRHALIAGLLASVSFGMVGSFVVARRITYIAGAIAHAVLAGIGAALYYRAVADLPWLHPMHGAVAAALTAALLIGLVSLFARQREDTVIGAIWAVGMAVGLIFLAKTPGYVDPMSYLFGNILLISQQDLWMVAGLDLLVVVLGVLFYNKLVGISFDEEFARVRGIRTDAYYLLLLILTALTVVLLLTVVGLVMVIALLTLPAGAAGQLTRRMWQMMALSIAFCMVFTTGGLGLSYMQDLPAGPIIIVVAGGFYLLVTLISAARARLS